MLNCIYLNLFNKWYDLKLLKSFIFSFIEEIVYVSHEILIKQITTMRGTKTLMREKELTVHHAEKKRIVSSHLDFSTFWGLSEFKKLDTPW